MIVNLVFYIIGIDVPLYVIVKEIYRSPVFVSPDCQNAKITRSNVRIELPYILLAADPIVEAW